MLHHLRILEIHSYHVMIACVVAGMGITLVPESILNGLSQKMPDSRFKIQDSRFKIHGLPKKYSHGALKEAHRGPKTNKKSENLLKLLKK